MVHNILSTRGSTVTVPEVSPMDWNGESRRGPEAPEYIEKCLYCFISSCSTYRQYAEQ
jgi:hypothetical protein